MYCYEKNVLNILCKHSHYIAIKAVAKKVVDAPITPQSTKGVKSLKFDSDPIGPFSYAPQHVYHSRWTL